jgi:hypothetical protein
MSPPYFSGSVECFALAVMCNVVEADVVEADVKAFVLGINCSTSTGMALSSNHAVKENLL